MTTPEEQLLELTGKKELIEEAKIANLFDQLKPVQSEFMLGDWLAGYYDTGHMTNKDLAEMRWAGKCFRTVNDIDPVMVYDDNGNRVHKKEFGQAQLRQVEYHGVVSACMIYDTMPIMDHFRYLNEETVVGAMDSKLHAAIPNVGTFYFYLTRMK
ncbi:uncharacterized protein BYT42DRAFT_614880 [Radiomyces spectabilis]|uniref:uncharacterized protein n=1 Tax=Radiomyces spectabilis TaxID=64574 RepID=UPI00221F3535|nr:uncharacterized protein BYT42DRAFT_614880 [Radiomyces spectabilis]KAI8376095.1 hypothetical protein BYT42DRAFT_614880 [Radiomyces spectabilis]